MEINKFLGINNVADPMRLAKGEMTLATDLDVGSTSKLLARRGHTALVTGTTAHSVFEASFGVFCVINRDLKLFSTAGTLLRTVYEELGDPRVWYLTLSDGRVAFSNGLINGIADLTTTADWGVPAPVDAGAGVPGSTPYMVTYVRTSDGLEGPPAYGYDIDPTQAVIGLPVRAGYSINLYIAPAGAKLFAGSTTTDTVTPTSTYGAVYVEPPLAKPPVGTVMTQFGSRLLLADGNVVWATQAFRPELCDVSKDFVQFPDPVTLIYGVEQVGVFFGTTSGLYFANGATFNDLKLQSISAAPVILGSGVEIATSFLPEKIRPKDVQQGMLCILDGFIQLLSGSGAITALTDQRYRTSYTEVIATARIRNGVLQYLAAPV